MYGHRRTGSAMAATAPTDAAATQLVGTTCRSVVMVACFVFTYTFQYPYWKYCRYNRAKEARTW